MVKNAARSAGPLGVMCRRNKENQPSPKTPYRKQIAKHLFKRHECRVKRQRIDQCSKSLCWLEE